MTSGLKGNEWLVPYSNLKNDIIMTYQAEDPITYVLNKPLIDEPGENFQYYGEANFVLGEIIKNSTLNTVAVFTGGNYLSYRPNFEILKKYILPAFK
jgi:CubicO group peptidase (beta-lactamase class C family)